MERWLSGLRHQPVGVGMCCKAHRGFESFPSPVFQRIENRGQMSEYSARVALDRRLSREGGGAELGKRNIKSDVIGLPSSD